jgi:hypothetical protein
MTKYLISFPSAAMNLTPDDFEAAGRDAHALLREAKEAGVWVFGGGIDEGVPSLMVAADGSTSDETYPQTKVFDGGFAVLEILTREEAIRWAAKFAVACRCSQELRQFMDDPES